jgi:hypothetical protein
MEHRGVSVQPPSLGPHRRGALHRAAKESHFTEAKCIQRQPVPVAVELRVCEAHFGDVFGKCWDQASRSLS